MEPEIRLFLTAIEEALSAVVGCLGDLDGEAIRWQPLPTANCLAVIVKHSLANAERNVMHTFVGEPYSWQRDREFVVDGDTAESLRAAWQTLHRRMWEALNSLSDDSLDEPRQHPRMGTVTGRAVLMQAARHVSEHEGEAKLTRSLLLARE